MIVGLDLGTRRVAAACPEVGWTFRYDLESERHRRDYSGEWEAGTALGRRLWSAVISSGHDALVLGEMTFFFERPLLGRPHGNSRTAIGQGLSAGAVLARVISLGPAVQIENSSTWKKELIGDGRAGKPECRAWLEDHHPALAALCGQDQDLVDAHCIALWAGLAPPG